MCSSGPACLSSDLQLLERVRNVPPLARVWLSQRPSTTGQRFAVHARTGWSSFNTTGRAFSAVRVHFSSGRAATAEAPQAHLQPSPELRGAAKEQLQLLQALLGRGSDREYECSFFLRHPSQVQNSNLMQLECIASLGWDASLPGLSASSREREVLVLDKTDPQFHKMQRLLREQEVVLLPDSSGLLMPVLTAEKKLAAVGASLERPQHAFSPAELQAVQLVVSTLGKACTIENRAALDRGKLNAVHAQADTLVSEVNDYEVIGDWGKEEGGDLDGD
ncbi:hypothetical protein WJX84_008041 [Apatococcus fuscideae]|uniref:Uncharacterized protein n=1 Tax=Apatococcus fuscideae TaxID=2026836 RepID=A0AAW1RUY0_9CHLO